MKSVLIAGVALLSFASFAHAAETEQLPPREFPQGAQKSAPISRPDASGRESQQSINGNTFTVIAPLFEHDFGNVSYVRFSNPNLATASITVTIVGTPTGHMYGTALLTIPANASKQFAYTEVLHHAGVQRGGYIGGDEGFSFYVSADTDGNVYSHVIHNADNKFFENMSVCVWRNDVDNTGLVRTVNNVHTTSPYMVEYPSYIHFHHYGSSPAVYAARLYRSTDGAYMGGFTFNMAPNASYLTSAQWYITGTAWRPTAAESHMNVRFSRNDGGEFQGIASHFVGNNALGAFVNMTQFCSINRR